MIEILGTRSNLPASPVIRWGLSIPISHIAILMDGKFLFQSNFVGAHPMWFHTFQNHTEVVFRVPLTLTRDEEDDVYTKIYEMDGTGYDWGAFFYFIIMAIRFKIFGIPIPKRNLWGSRKLLLCTELETCLPERYRVPDLDSGIVDPYTLIEHIIEVENERQKPNENRVCT